MPRSRYGGPAIDTSGDSQPQESRSAADKRVIARNTLANAGVRFLQFASAFIYMPFLISGFGLANYGVFLLASSLSIYLGLLDFGMNPTVVKHVAEYVARDRRTELARLVSNAVSYYALIGVLAAAALALFARYGVGLLALGSGDAQLAARLFYVAAAVALFMWPLSTGAAVLNGLQRYDLSSAVNAVVVVGNLVITAAVLAFGEGPLVLFAATGVLSVAAGGMSCVLAARHLRGVQLSPRLVDGAGLRAILGFSWMLFVMQLAVVISDQQTDRFVLAAFVGAAAIGLYEPASKLHGLIAQLASLPSAALIPAASKIHAEARPEVLRSLYLRGSKYTVVFVTPIAVTAIVLAPPLLLTWLGPELAAMATAARVFLVIYLMYANLVVAFPVFIGMGRVRFIMWYNLGTALTNLGLSLLLVRPFGVVGVVVGTVAADTLLFPLGMWYALRTLEIRPAEYLRRVVLPAYPLLVVPGLVAGLLHVLGSTDSLVGVGLTGAFAVGVYWLAMYRFGLDPHEREDARALLSRLRSFRQREAPPTA